MECGLCVRRPQYGLRFHCPACARNALYVLRINLAKSLLEKEALGRQVNYILSPTETRLQRVPTVSGAEIPLEENTKRYHHERQLTDIENSRGRVEQIVEQVDRLRSQLDEYKKEIAARRTSMLERRRKLTSATAKVQLEYSSHNEPLTRKIRKVLARHDLLYREIVSARVYLCREAALHAGLSRREAIPSSIPPDLNGTQVLTREVYMLAGLPIPDLRQLNKVPPDQVSHVFLALARLLDIVCHYLSIRLPAEITLSHRDYPLPTIFTPSSSYLERPIIFPGARAKAFSEAVTLTPESPSATVSPTEEDPSDAPIIITKPRALPRPRPLFLAKPLPQLLREDTNAYSLFLEGAVPLAWNVAWLCHSQGVSLPPAENPSSLLTIAAPLNKLIKRPAEWEEICAVGRNLYLLLSHPRSNSQPTPVRPLLGQRLSSKNTNTPRPVIELPQQGLGVLGHGTAHHHASLEAKIGTMTSSSSAPSILTVGGATSIAAVVDRVKAHLSAEVSGNEWELLDFAKDRAMGASGESDMVREHVEAQAAGKMGYGAAVVPAESADGSPGTSGWTKLRSRGASDLIR